MTLGDTDSIVYKTSLDPAGNIPESKVLGGWEEEDVSKDGIIEFVGYGPKCYSMKTEQMADVMQPNGTSVYKNVELIKLKGIRQSFNVQGITHDHMKEQMLKYLETGVLETTMVPQWGIKTQLCRDGLTVVTSDHYSKDFKLMDDDHLKGCRMMVEGVRDPKVYPFGFVLT